MKKKCTSSFHLLNRGFICKCLCTLSLLLTVIPMLAQHYARLANHVTYRAKAGSNAVELLKVLEQQTPYVYTYDADYLQKYTLPAVSFSQQPLGEVLGFLDQHAPVDIELTGSTIAIRKSLPQPAPGKVVGLITDERNEPLPGVTIKTANGQGGISGVDGRYELALPAGIYTLEFSFLSYQTRRVTEVQIISGKNTPLNMVLKPSTSALKEVVITGNYRQSSVEGLYQRQKNAAMLTDGISSEQIARTPDKNIGEVLNRISGVSTVDNKYVVVRGMSERYTMPLLNGMQMPSTELNRKNFSFDLIPADLVENVVVTKTNTPDMPGEFGGGAVNVSTKDIPDENFLTITAGTGYNDNTTFKDFHSLKRTGNMYWGKFGDDRRFPSEHAYFVKDVNSPQPAEIAAVKAQSKYFANNWGVYNNKAVPNQNYQLTAGHSWQAGKQKTSSIGVLAALTYRNTQQTDDVYTIRNKYDRGFNGKQYRFTTNVGGIAGLAFRTPQHKISWQTLFLRNLDNRFMEGFGVQNSFAEDSYGYYESTQEADMWQHQLKGEHALGKKNIKLQWTLGYLRLDKEMPDYHKYAARIANTGGFKIDPATNHDLYDEPRRYWSFANESNYNWDINIKVPFRFLNATQSIKAGYAGWRKQRSFGIYFAGAGNLGASGAYVFPEIFDAATDTNALTLPNGQFRDAFEGKLVLHAGYLMLDNQLFKNLRLVWGLRAENVNLNSMNSRVRQIEADMASFGNKFDKSSLFGLEPNMNWLPSANLTYSLTPQMNLRLAYARSLIRPDMRELSYFVEYDYELGGEYTSTFIQTTRINHYDFRFEWYPGPGEIMSVSTFYKYFQNPMEIFRLSNSLNIYELRNDHSARVFGMEAEVRKSLAFTKVPVIKNLMLYGNFTAIRSSVRTQSTAIVPGANDMSIWKIIPDSAGYKSRPLSGLSNYVANAGIYYDTKYFGAALLYNYTSNKLQVLTIGESGSEEGQYEKTPGRFDAQLRTTLLKGKLELRFNIRNLNNVYSTVYQNSYTEAERAEIKEKGKIPLKWLLYDKGKDLDILILKPYKTFSLSAAYRF